MTVLHLITCKFKIVFKIYIAYNLYYHSTLFYIGVVCTGNDLLVRDLTEIFDTNIGPFKIFCRFIFTNIYTLFTTSIIILVLLRHLCGDIP